MEPVALTDLEVIFPASVAKLLPVYKELPDDFRQQRHPMCQLASKWFFLGLKSIKFKDGIDAKAAASHLQACLGSFEPKHEHKIAGVGYLMSLWVEEAIPNERA